jgi:hypothetical protein
MVKNKFRHASGIKHSIHTNNIHHTHAFDPRGTATYDPSPVPAFLRKALRPPRSRHERAFAGTAQQKKDETHRHPHYYVDIVLHFQKIYVTRLALLNYIWHLPADGHPLASFRVDSSSRFDAIRCLLRTQMGLGFPIVNNVRLKKGWRA